MSRTTAVVSVQVVFYTLHGKLLPETEVFKTQEAAEAGAREYVAAGAAWEKSGSGEHDQHQEEEDDAEDGEGEGNPQENDGARDNQQPADVQERQAAAVEDTDAADQAEDDLFEKELASIIPGQVRVFAGSVGLLSPQRYYTLCIIIGVHTTGQCLHLACCSICQQKCRRLHCLRHLLIPF